MIRSISKINRTKLYKALRQTQNEKPFTMRMNFGYLKSRRKRLTIIDIPLTVKMLNESTFANERNRNEKN